MEKYNGFDYLKQSAPTNWHSSHPNYRLLYYKDIEVSQVVGALQLLNADFFAQFDTIVEIGSYFGGLSLWINDHKKEESVFVSYDIDPSLNVASKNDYNIDFRIEDCFSEKGKNEIIEFIKRSGKTLLICDGGNKNKEFIEFSQHLKENDVIMLHDFLFDAEYFKLVGEHWQWPYGPESDFETIKNAVVENKLYYYPNFQDFVSVYWGIFVKNYNNIPA